MAEYAVLHQEPRYRVDEWVDELLVWAQRVVARMGTELERLLRALVGQFRAYHLAHPGVALRDVQFETVRWTPDGRLAIAVTVAPTVAAPEEDAPELRHRVIDAFVDDVVGRTVPVELRGEFRQFARGMVYQLAVLRKHTPLDLDQIRFAPPEWHDARTVVVRMTHRGQPLTPRDVRWD